MPEQVKNPQTSILIVEDARFVAARLERTLSELGYDVPGAVASGEEALQVVSERPPDLVLMDIDLAGELNGIETAARIHARFEIPVIYLTAYAQDALLQQAKVTEPYGYLIKPVQDRELYAAIEMALYRHKLETQLKEKERWLDATLRGIGDAVIATNKEGRVTFMNPVAEDLTGWEQTEALGRDLTQIFHVVDNATGDAIENLVEQVIQKRDVVGLISQTLLIKKDGTPIPIDDSAAPVRDDKGNISGVVLVFRNVTARARAEREIQTYREHLEELVQERTEALQTEKEKAQQYLDVAGVAFVALDSNGRVTLVNKRGQDLLGYGEAELIGRNWFETCVPERLRGRVHGVFKRLMTGELEPVEYFENLVLTKSGAERTVAWNNTMLRDAAGNIIGTLSSGEDITERVQTEKDIRRRNRELALLNRVIAASTSTLDVEQVLEVACQELAHALDLPQAAAALFNAERTQAQVIAEYLEPGRPSALWKTIPGTDNPATEYILAHKAPLAVTDAQTDELLAPVRDMMRERGTLSLLIVPVMERDEVVGTIGLDAIERREFDEDEITLAQNAAAAAGQALETAQLYQELQRHTAQLAHALERQRDLDRLRSEFIQNVSHELRTPLALARGHIELLEDGVLGELQPDQLESVAVSSRRLQALSKLVDDITGLLDTEREGMTQDPVDLAGLVQAMLANFQSTAEQAELTLTAQVAPDLPPVLGDPIQLQQAVDSLLDNAHKFTPAGGRITVRMAQEGQNLVLEVSDTGIGISDDQLERVFERFYQVDGSTTRRYGGTGLGLALVKESVEAHGGQVTVQSVLGEGSTFSVTLPICPVSPQHED